MAVTQLLLALMTRPLRPLLRVGGVAALVSIAALAPRPALAVDEALVERFERLLKAPMDDPRLLELVMDTAPSEAMEAAAELGRRNGNRIGPLHVYLHGMAAMIEADPPGFEVRLREGLQAADGHFFPPDLIAALDQIVAELDAERVSLRHRASIYEKTGGIPLPRKRIMDGQTGELTPYTYDRLFEERRTLVANEEQLSELRDRYPVLMAEMGLYYENRSNLVMAFDCLSRSLRMDYEAWVAADGRYDEAYLNAASFMVLSAHRSDDVLALYHLTPMDPKPLEHLIVKQIDQRSRIYAKAADQYTNHASVNQALRDLLYTLIEDEGAIEFLPESERRRFLETIGKTALAKRHYQEAIGVYATLGDNKKLIALGEKLSKSVYTTRRGRAYINRDLSWAIDAFREAGADKEMAELLERVDEAKQDLDRGKLKVDDASVLVSHWKKLDDYVHGGADHQESVLDTRAEVRAAGAQVETAQPKEVQADASAEELPVLIRDYSAQVRKAVPGQDLAYIQSRLLLLGEQAERTQRLGLAVEAYAHAGAAGAEKANLLIQDLSRKQRYGDATRLLLVMGPAGEAQLSAMATEILARGVAPRGVFNPDVRYAVEALIALDDVDRVEGVLNELLRLKVQFAGLQNQAETAGRAVANRNLSQLEDTLKLIKEAYEIVGSPSAAPPPAPAPEPAEDAAPGAEASEG